MLVCASAELVAWRPNFASSGQANPQWTKLLCNGEQLTNSIEWVEWLGFLDDPAIQVELCESCGVSSCASGGYVHVSRLGSHVLWTLPHIDPGDAFESHQYRATELVQRHGGIAFPVGAWENWRAQFAALPAPDRFPPTERRDLFAAWRGQAPVFGPFDQPEDFVEIAHERAVAANPSSLDEVLAQVEAMADWLGADEDAPVDGELVNVSDQDAAVETIYFDVPDTFDRPVLREWRPTAHVAGRLAPVFGPLALIEAG